MSAGAQESARGHDQAHFGHPGRQQRLGAGGRGRPGREHVVDEQHVRGRLDAPWHDERSSHGGAPGCRVTFGLRSARHHSPEQAPHRKVEFPPERHRKDPGLVEAALGLASAGQRHPRDDVGPGRSAGRHRRRERTPGSSDPPVLEVMHRSSRGTLERERGPRTGDRGGGALAAAAGVLTRRSAATFAPGRRQGAKGTPAPHTERPRTVAAPRAPRREHHVERPLQHRRDDSVAVRHRNYGRSSSTGAAAPRTVTERRVWVLAAG